MENHKPDTTGKFLEDLIAAEEKEALARFRAGDFRSRIENRLKSAAGQKRPPFHSRRIIRPAWAGAAALIILGTAILPRILHQRPRPDFAPSVESVLRLMPGFQAIEGSAALSSEMRVSTASSWEKTIADALSRRSAGVSLSQGRTPESRAGQIRRGRPLGLEEIYKILFMEKSVERVLSLIS
jgi:hypothetical protein